MVHSIPVLLLVFLVGLSSSPDTSPPPERHVTKILRVIQKRAGEVAKIMGSPCHHLLEGNYRGNQEHAAIQKLKLVNWTNGFSE